jgi:hypothetical protein
MYYKLFLGFAFTPVKFLPPRLTPLSWPHPRQAPEFVRGAEGRSEAERPERACVAGEPQRASEHQPKVYTRYTRASSKGLEFRLTVGAGEGNRTLDTQLGKLL